MNIEDQDDLETKEWEEALSLVESIFKDFKENSPDSDEPNNDLLDVARWKVVWGKKPAQYRLKPFLMWSVDEMPSIPEECESFSEAAHKDEEVNEILKIKKDKQVRFLKRKMFKMKRRIDEINVVLAKTLSDETVASLREEDPTKAAMILQLGAQRVELMSERNIIRDKLRKLNKKLILFKGPSAETSRLLGQRQDLGDAPQSSDIKETETEEQTTNRSEVQAGEPAWSFKNGRRLAIKKEAKTTWNKPGSAQAKDAPRSSCDLAVDRKTKKKRCCKGHHRKHEPKIGTSSETDTLGRQALSENDLSTGAKDQGEMSQQKHLEALEGVEKIRKNELRTSRSTELHKELTADRAVGTSAKDRLPAARAGQEVCSVNGRGSRTRRNSVAEESALTKDKESVSSQTGSQTAGNQIKLGLKQDIHRTARSATDLGAEDQKRSPETSKHWKTKRSNSTKDGRAARTTYTRTKTAENKDFTAKSRPWKSVENANRAEQPDVSAKRMPISNVPS